MHSAPEHSTECGIFQELACHGRRDFTQKACQSGNNDPSNYYCVCDQGAQRTVCTVGLHTIMAGSRDHSNDTSLSPLLRSNGAYTGLLKIQNTRLEKRGQRGMKGR